MALIEDLEQNIADLEFKLELLDSELQEIFVQMPDSSTSEHDVENAVAKLVTGLSSSASRSILMESFTKLIESEVRFMDY